MRLKEIKPGMVIHCKNDEEKEALLEEAEKLGYKWNNNCVPTDFSMFKKTGMTIHFYNKDERKDYKYITWSDNTDGATEFSDLILPELTAEEVLSICGEICKEYSNKGCDCEVECPFSYHGPSCTVYRAENYDKVIEACEKYKSEHEKKEPEIETVEICRIIEIQPDGKKRCVHEEDISDGELMYSGDAVENCRYILKNYCKEHDGEFIAVHEVVSRVKKCE